MILCPRNQNLVSQRHFISLTFVDIRTLSNLSTLYLNNIITNERTFQIQSPGYLKTLYLRENNFKGTIFAQGKFYQ